MDASNDILFDAELTPHRSLGRRGFLLVMAFVSVVCLTVGISFWFAGVWPVIGFMGLDIVLIYVALKASYRSARAREMVAVTREAVTIEKIAPSGARARHLFNPFGTFFEVDRHPEYGVTRMKLRNRDRVVPVGTFLDNDSKTSFAEAFSHALSRAKR